MKVVLVNIYQIVQLLDRQNIKVLMDQEELHLMVERGILYRGHQNVYQFSVNICMNIQIQGVNEHSDLE